MAISLITGLSENEETTVGTPFVEPDPAPLDDDLQAALNAYSPDAPVERAATNLRAAPEIVTPEQADRDFEDSQRLQIPVSVLRSLPNATRQFLLTGDMDALEAAGTSTVDFVRMHPEISQTRVAQMAAAEGLWNNLKDVPNAASLFMQAEKQAKAENELGLAGARLAELKLSGLDAQHDAELAKIEQQEAGVTSETMRLESEAQTVTSQAAVAAGKIAGYPLSSVFTRAGAAAVAGTVFGGPVAGAVAGTIAGTVGALGYLKDWWERPNRSNIPLAAGAMAVVGTGAFGPQTAATAGLTAFGLGDIFVSETGASYLQMVKLKDAQGNKMPADQALVGAVTAGAINTVVEGVSAAALAAVGAGVVKAVPGAPGVLASIPVIGKVFKGMTRTRISQLVSAAVSRPELAARVASIFTAWQAGALEQATEEWAQYVFPQIIQAIMKERSNATGATKFQVDSLLQDIDNQIAAKTFRDTWVGSSVLGLMGAPAGYQSIRQLRQDQTKAQAFADALGEFKTAIDELELPPSGKKIFVRDFLEGTKDAYIDGEDAVSLFQSNAKIAAALGLDPEAAQKAAATGDAVKFDVSNLLVDLSAPEYKQVAELLKVSPGAISLKEAKALSTPEAKARAIELLDEATRPDSELNTLMETKRQELFAALKNTQVTTEQADAAWDKAMAFAYRAAVAERTDMKAMLSRWVFRSHEDSVSITPVPGPTVGRDADGNVVMDDKFNKWFGNSYTRDDNGNPIKYKFDGNMMTPAGESDTETYYVSMKNPKEIQSEAELDAAIFERSIPDNFIRKAAELTGKDWKDVRKAYRKKGSKIAQNQAILAALETGDKNMHAQLTRYLQNAAQVDLNKQGFDGLRLSSAAPAGPATTPIGQRTSAELSTQTGLSIVDIQYSKLRVWDKATNLVTEKSGAAGIVDFADRMIVVVNAGGVNIPFYLSSGLAGKKLTKPGQWYPIAGIDSSGWLNKGTDAELANYYGSPGLRQIAERLDATIGNVGKDPSILGVSAKAIYDSVNSGLTAMGLAPTANGTANTSAVIARNIQAFATAADKYTPAPPAAPTAPGARTTTEKIYPAGPQGNILLTRSDAAAEQALAQRVVAGLRQTVTTAGSGPAIDDTLAGPPTYYQIQDLPEWEATTRDWMKVNGYTKAEIDARIKDMSGIAAVLSAVGKITEVNIDMFPRGNNHQVLMQHRAAIFDPSFLPPKSKRKNTAKQLEAARAEAKRLKLKPEDFDTDLMMQTRNREKWLAMISKYPAIFAYLDGEATQLRAKWNKSVSRLGTIRSNQDKIYKLSVDVSAMCPKRIEMAATVRLIEEMMANDPAFAKRPFMTKDESIALMLAFQHAGKVSPCTYCYVEGPRMKAIQFVQSFAEALAFSPPATEEYTNSNGKTRVWVTFPEDGVKRDWSQTTLAKWRAAKAEAGKAGLTPAEIPLVNWTDEERIGSQADLKFRAAYPAIDKFFGAAVDAAKANKPKPVENYAGELLQVPESVLEELRQYAGLRMFSSSDYQIDHVVDIAQLIYDMSLRDMPGHCYTKVPDFIRVFGDTGIKIQCSIVARKDKNGKIVMDAANGMDWKTAMEFRQKHDNVAIMLMATDDDIIEWGLNQNSLDKTGASGNMQIDMIIPFHSSAGFEKVYWGRTGLGWKDYTNEQYEWARNTAEKDRDPALRMGDLKVSAGMTNQEMKKVYLDLLKNERPKNRPAFAGVKMADGRSVVEHDHYMKLRKDYGRADTPFTAPDPERIDWDEFANTIRRVNEGEAPKATPDQQMATNFLKMLKESTKRRIAPGIYATTNGYAPFLDAKGKFSPKKFLQENRARQQYAGGSLGFADTTTINVAAEDFVSMRADQLMKRLGLARSFAQDQRPAQGKLYDGTVLRTGDPVTFTYLRNPEKSVAAGARFQQDIEPAGRYVTEKFPAVEAPPGWETGSIRFENPLVIPFNRAGSMSYDTNSWKALLADRYGKTGKALSLALLADGYDGIITVWGEETQEIVDLSVVGRRAPVSFAQTAAQTSTPEFKAWFGDSKVVGENGEPLVVYHGTRAMFDTFDPATVGRNFPDIGFDRGFFFAKKAEDADPTFLPGDGAPRLLSVFLSAQNPHMVTMRTGQRIPGHFARAVSAADWFDNNTASIMQGAADAGADGIIVRNESDPNDVIYIVFDPAQIKSATDNRGTFDPNNPNIFYASSNDALANFLSTKGQQVVTKQEVMEFLATQAPGSGRTIAGSTTPLPDSLLVTFFRSADPSTVIHELAHVFLLEMQSWIGAKGIAAMDPDFQTDWAALCKWLQVDPQVFDTTQVDQHEKFARAFEKYVREGNAPSPNLVPSFAKYRQWLMRVYQRAADIDYQAQQEINLTPEMRQFFNRMLATEQEIEMASIRLSLGFSEAELAAMSLGDADKEYLRRLHKKAQEKGKEKVHKRRAQIRADVMQNERELVKEAAEREPVLLAREGLKQNPLGAGLIEANYGADVLADLQSQGVTKKGATRSAGQAAIDYGFTTAQELIEALRTTPKKPDWIRAELARRMAEYDKAHDLEADLLNTQEAQDYLAAVSKFLEQKTPAGKAVNMQNQMIRQDAVKRVVEDRFKNMPLSEATNVDRFLVQFRAQTKKTRDAVAKQDWQAALQANQKARFMFEAVRQSRRLRDAVRKQEQRVTQALRSDTIEINYRTALVNLARDFGLTDRSMDPDGRLSLIDILRPPIDPDTAPWAIPPQFSDFLFAPPQGQTQQTKYNKLPVWQAKELFDALKYLEKKGRKILSGRLDSQKLTLDDALVQLLGALQEMPDRTVAQEGTLARAMQDFAAGYLAPMEVMQYMLEAADGYTTNGPHTRLIWDKINMGATKKAARLRKIQTQLKPILDRISARGQAVDLSKLPLPYLFQKNGMVWTWQRVIGFALQMGNEYNANAAITGYELGSGELQSIVSLLTKQDWLDVQAIWDITNSLWPDLKKAYERINVLAPGKVAGDPLTIRTADGEKITIAGGYFPLKFDGRLVLRVGEWDEKADFLAQVQASFPTPNVPAGYMNERRGTGGLPPALDFGGVLASHLDMTTTYIYLADVLGDADRMLRGSVMTDEQKLRLTDPKMKPSDVPESQDERAQRSYPATFVAKFSMPQYKQFRPWLARIATGKSNVAQTTLDRVGASTASMGAAQALWGNVGSAIKQVTGVAGYFNDPDVGFYTFVDGLSELAARPAETIQMVLELSPSVMDKRWNAFDPSLNEMLAKTGIEQRYGTEALEMMRHAGMLPMNLVDSLTTFPAWVGTFRREMRKHGNRAQAIAKADSITTKHQPSARPQDIVGYQRDARGLASWFFAFSGWRLKFATKIGYQFGGYARGRLSGIDVARFAAIEWLMPVVAGYAILSLVRALPGIPEPPDAETAKDLSLDALSSLLGCFPLIGDALQVGIRKMVKSKASEFDTVAARAMDKIISGVVDLFEALEKPGSEKAKAAIWAFCEIVSTVLRVPVTKLYSDVMRGWEQAERTGEWGRLLLPKR